MSLFLSVVIPAYNESENIGPTVHELEEVIENCTDVADYEIIVMDDHSSDGTFQTLLSLNRQNRRVRGLRLSRQKGSHIAIRAGMAHARGSAILFVAADGQDDPRLLNEMIAKLRLGNHIVWALRKQRETSWFYNLAAAAAYRLIGFLVPSMPLDRHLAGADFFICSREFKEAIASCKERHTSIFGLMAWAGFQHDSIQYERRKRRSGDSKWRFRARWRLLMDWIAAFSGIPLKIASMTGSVLMGLGLLGGGVLLYRFFVLESLPRWIAVADLILFLMGLQMFFLGVIGEYLWRNLEEVRERPLFFIEASTDRQPSLVPTQSADQP